MSRTMKRATLALAGAVAASCGGGRSNAPPPSPAPGPTQAVPAETWRPPADGRLTPRHVELYIKALERLRAAAAARQRPTPETAPSLGEPLDAALDVGIGRALYGSVEQYLWVKERILEAEGAQLAAKISADALALLSRTIADLKVRREKAPDEGSKKLISEQLANFEAEADRTLRESKEREPEAVRANMRTLDAYRSRLAALEEEVRRVMPAASALAARARTPTPRTPTPRAP